MRKDLLWLAVCTGCIVSLVVFSLAGTGFPLQGAVVWVKKEAEVASIFFVQSITSSQIQETYSKREVRILIVPGHQPDAGGTVFNAVYERDIVVDIAETLSELLKKNSRYAVMVARDKTEWHPVLKSYFDTNTEKIEAFRQSQALQMANHLADGKVLLEEEQVDHLTALPKAALQLYGINKWAGENEYHITLHLHLNDYAGRRVSRVGKHDGFTIYVPDRQYSNAEASREIAGAIATRLNAYHATSTLPKEDRGVVEDQQLIAIGSNNSADAASLLIEYGYIYEPQFQNPSVRAAAVRDYAYQTYLGLQDFFNDPVPATYGSVTLPYDWTKVTAEKNERSPDIFALQVALHFLGYYPPANKNFSDCPISGVAGICTRLAIEAYQRAHNLETTGMPGPKTRLELEQDLSMP